MAFNVDNFISNIQRYGTLQNNKFEVVFKRLPRGLSNLDVTGQTYSAEILRLLTNRADNIRVPGYILDSIENRRYGIGPNDKTATNVRYEPVNVAFIETADSNISKFFYDWANFIFNTGPGIPSYNVAYKNDYITEVDIKVYNNWGKPTSERGRIKRPSVTYTLYEVFPLSVSDNDLSWDENNRLAKINVSLAFSYFQKETNSFNALKYLEQ